jgi:hypothetical protein
MNENIISIEEKERAINNIIIALSEDTYSIKMDKIRLDQICSSLNTIFPEGKCKEVIYTVNSDKLPFGIYIDPAIRNYDLMNILFDDSDEIFRVKEYRIEIDSKLFMEGLTPEDITKMILHDVELMLSAEVSEKLRSLIDIYTSSIDKISVKNSINANAILTYAIKDTLNKLTSSLYGKYDFKFAVDEMIDKISKVDYENISIYDNFPKVIILQWAFMVYGDIKTNYAMIKSTLEEAEDLTGSVLIKDTIEKTIAAINRTGFEFVDESTNLVKFIEQKNIPINEISIFKSLKTNGLRAIENDYYEYAILVKSASDENEAMYALRGINTRINILTDYIYNTPGMSDAERKHWEGVVNMYQDLRIKLTKKNIINKKSYGIWFDYSKLDNLDKAESDY